nr:PAS domain-containing protein [Methanoculleus sp. CWC-02]
MNIGVGPSGERQDADGRENRRGYRNDAGVVGSGYPSGASRRSPPVPDLDPVPIGYARQVCTPFYNVPGHLGVTGPDEPASPLPPELQSTLAILDALDEGIFLVDRSNRVISVNRWLASFFGLDRDALAGIDIDCFMRRYLPACVADDERTARITASFPDWQDFPDTPCTIRTPGAEERELLISGNRIEDGRLEGMGIVRFREITGEMRAKQELLACTAKYRTIFDSLDAGFSIIEMIFHAGDRPADYRFIETNRAFERLTGMHDVAGKTMRELAPGHEEHWFEIFGAVARTGEARRFVQTAKC